MIRFSTFKYSRALLAFMAVLLIFLTVADVVTVSHQRKEILDEAHRNAETELNLMGTLVREALLKHDYATVEQSLTEWGKEDAAVIEIKATAPNGFVLAQYKRAAPSEHTFNIQQRIQFAGKDLVALEIVKDFTSVEKSLKELYLQLVTASVFLTIILGIALWFTLRKMALIPMEREIARRRQAEDALQKANDELEIRVEERTGELRDVNEQLLSEITERKRIEEEIKQDYHVQSVISSVLRISMEPVSLEEQLVRILDFILSVPWLSLQSKGCIFLREENADVLVMKAHKGLSESLQGMCAKVPFGKCLCGKAASVCEIVFADCIDDRHAIHYQGMLPHGHYNIPIMSGNKVLGVIGLYIDEGHQRNEKEEEFLTAIANALAGVIERTQAEEQIKEESEISSSLLQIFETLNASLDERQLIADVVDIIPKYLKFDKVGIFLYEQDLRGFIASGSYGHSPVEEGILLTKTFKEGDFPAIDTIIKGESVIVNDAKKYTLLSKDFIAVFNIESAVLLPIFIGGRVRGMLIGGYRNVQPVQSRDESLLKGLADGLGVAIHNSRLYKESTERLMELSNKVETIKAMSQIDREILSAIDKDTVLNTSIALISRVISCDRASILFREKAMYRVITEWGVGELHAKTYKLTEKQVDIIENNRTPLFIPDLSLEPVHCPYYQAQIDIGIKSMLMLPLVSKGETIGIVDIGSVHPARFTPEHLSTAENLAAQITVALENASLYEDLQQLLINTITSFASVIDAKSPWTRGHSERVTQYAIAIGMEMKLDKTALETLRLAGILHDIGKIGLYDVVLDKPDKLTSEEFELVKEHSVKGASILEPIKQLKGIISVIKYHHERIDGKGYPDGLKGEEIPLLSRILCVADSYDSMTANRPYRKAYGKKFAIKELKYCSGKQFDPKVVEAFLKVLDSPGIP